MSRSISWTYALLVFSGIAYGILHYGIVRADFVGTPNLSQFAPLALLFFFLSAAYLMLLKMVDGRKAENVAITAAMLFRVGLIFCLPNLSDDFYRFVWDGRMLLEGQNPFDLLPDEWLATMDAQTAAKWTDLHAQLNSRPYYSVYPPVLQAVFWISTKLSGGALWGSIAIMKSIVVLAEGASIWFLIKLLKMFNLPRKQVLLYALNPLVIIELSGNLHFEALMICFLLATLWLLGKSKLLAASAMLALSIGSKLLPVLIFPFLIKRLGWKRFFIFGAITFVICLVMFGILLDAENLPHFQESVRHYFQKFEFNGGIYYTLRKPLGEQGYWINRILPWLVVCSILLLAWRERQDVWKELAALLMLTLGIYQLHSPVIHPWYLAPLVALAALGPYRSPILWTLLIPYTYIAYYFPGFQENYFIIALEFLLVLGYASFEWTFRRKNIHLDAWILGKPWFKRWMMKTIPARLAIKKDRILRHLNSKSKHLDIGSGHGGLCLAFRNEGIDIQPLDIKNLSYFPEIEPVIYDGQHIPFPDKAFDCTLMITMLHHTPNPDLILDEAIRVSKKRLIVMEDVYQNWFQKQLTFFTDSLVNMEFDGHPHTNRRDKEWQKTFSQKGLKLISREEFRTLVFFRQVIYVLEIAE